MKGVNVKTTGASFVKEMVTAMLNNKKSASRRMSDRWEEVKKGDILWVKEDYYDRIYCVDTGDSETDKILTGVFKLHLRRNNRLMRAASFFSKDWTESHGREDS